MKNLLLLLVFVPFPLLADSVFGDVDENYDIGPENQWEEQAIEGLPDYPLDDDLLQLSSSVTDLKIFVDLRSIRPGKDNVVRLTVVMESPSGARTVYYEGYDCGFKRYKRYAYAGASGPLRELREAAWQQLLDVPQNAFRFELIDTYLCRNFAYAETREKIIKRLKSSQIFEY